jgi:gp16 family phage-associated protein
MSLPITKEAAAQVKQKLYEQKKTLRSFAADHGFKYVTVSNVLRGINKCSVGEGRAVAQKLGLI